MKFSEIAGHKATIDSLRSLVDKGNIPHAILLSGKPGIGKFRLARAFAQYVHCSNKKNGDSCGECLSCLQHQSLNNPDLHFIYPVIKGGLSAPLSKDYIEQWKEMVSEHSYMPTDKWNVLLNAGNSQPSIFVSESDNIIVKASLSSYRENHKIFLIWLPEKLRPEAANKLLKILEEPFEDTLFVLVSNDSNRILPTIYSRTFRYNLLPLDDQELKEVIEKPYGLDTETVEYVCSLAGGSVSKAEAIISESGEEHDFLELYKEMMRMAYGLKWKKLKEVSEKIASWGREKSIRFLNYSSRQTRENFIYNFKVRSLVEMTLAEEEFGSKFSPFVNAMNVETIMEELANAASDIERNANAKIVLFDMLLRISGALRKTS